MKRNQGFTLLELSVVLVIVSLVVGGIFLTRSLVREAKVRAVMVEYDQYLKAIQEFQDKYQALPGDMKTATGIWGAATLCPNTDDTTPPQFKTCNGDGDGRIGTSATDGTVSNSYEWWQAWQQLADAGMIDGRYNGAPGASHVQQAVIGTNVPESRLTPAGWTLLYYLNTAGVSGKDNYGHILSFGGVNSTTPRYTQDGGLLPSEAYGIDLKIDDGNAGMGKIRASGTADSASTYSTDADSEGSPIYSLIFILGM
jgi:prepilin-type N-terminal cleavage/methylation domain-containing protein